MDSFFTSDALVALLALTAMEIVLGIDNVVFISILASRLPVAQRPIAVRVGLGMALLMRIGLLLSIAWVIGLTEPLFSLFGRGVSGRDIILLGGGLVLIGKATWEIYDKLEADHHGAAAPVGRTVFVMVIAQILLMDMVFSLDSVITAVGMADDVRVMIAAMVIAMAVMVASAGPVSSFVERHPSVKILALSFLLLIGVMLVAEGTGSHINKGYIYAAMAFALLVEGLNLRYRRQRSPVQLHSAADAHPDVPLPGRSGGEPRPS